MPEDHTCDLDMLSDQQLLDAVQRRLAHWQAWIQGSPRSPQPPSSASSDSSARLLREVTTERFGS